MPLSALGRAVRPAAAAVLAALACGAGCIPDAPDQKVPGHALNAPAADAGASGGKSGDATDTKALLATVEARKAELKNRPRGFGVDEALGNLYYDNGKYIDAIEYYSDALAITAPEEKDLRRIAAAGRHDLKTPVPASCEVTEDSAGAVERIIAQACLLRTRDPRAGDACLAQLVPVVADARARRGNNWYLVGNADKAREDHQAALALDPGNGDALFFSGATALEGAHGDPALLAQGKAYWKKLLEVAPNHPRAELVRETMPRIDQLFGPQAVMPPGETVAATDDAAASASAPVLPAGMMEAMQNTKHTPEMDAQLDKTTDQGEALLQQRKWQEALDTFKQVMPLRPDGRIALDMGIALRELGKPTAERVLTMATQMPGGDPSRAKYELGMFYEKQDPAKARSIYQSLEADPRLGAAVKDRLARLP